MSDKIEKIPGVNASAGDVSSVDETLEHDFEFGKAGRTETIARAEDESRTDAARFREGARLIEGYDKSMEALDSKDGLSRSVGQQAPRAEQDPSAAIKAGEEEMERRYWGEDGEAAGDVSEILEKVPNMSPEDRKAEVVSLRADAAHADRHAKTVAKAAGEKFDRERREAAERVIDETKKTEGRLRFHPRELNDIRHQAIAPSDPGDAMTDGGMIADDDSLGE